MCMLWSDLGLQDEVQWMSQELQIAVYNECMVKLEQECVADLTELFLERSDLFNEISSPKDTFDHVHEELKVWLGGAMFHLAAIGSTTLFVFCCFFVFLFLTLYYNIEKNTNFNQLQYFLFQRMLREVVDHVRMLTVSQNCDVRALK